MTSHQLDVRLDAAVADPAVRALFEAAAGAFGTVFAAASVERDRLRTGRTLVVDRADPDAEPFLAPLGEWLGLPPRPPLWTWFGPGYRRMVPPDSWPGSPNESVPAGCAAPAPRPRRVTVVAMPRR